MVNPESDNGCCDSGVKTPFCSLREHFQGTRNVQLRFYSDSQKYVPIGL